MRKSIGLAVLAFVGGIALAPGVRAQRPYIGFVYPAGGQQGATFQVKLGGQLLDGVDEVLVSGTGVQARVVEYFRRLNPQDMTLLSEQLRELKHDAKAAPEMMAPMMDTMMMDSARTAKSSALDNPATGITTL